MRSEQGKLLRAPLQRIRRGRHLRIVVDGRLALADQHPPLRVAHAAIGQEAHRIGLLGPLRQRNERRIVDLEGEVPLHMPHQVVARLRHLPIAHLIHLTDKPVQMIDQLRIGMVAVLHGGLRHKVRPHRRAQREIRVDQQWHARVLYRATNTAIMRLCDGYAVSTIPAARSGCQHLAKSHQVTDMRHQQGLTI
ncbi:hypothetical protein IXO90_09920 [Xanthomonas oryzae pv. oryzae]|nr:hypothetical protein IXO90_09920 [Xanthomonas oryzae pv. oryzae]PNR63767.1 hypothetical protein LA07_04040 [Xanthomonas oryzae pv. oryzae]